MEKNELPKAEGISIISEQVYRKLRLIPKKVIEGRDVTLLRSLSDINRRTIGNVEAFIVDWYCPHIEGYSSEIDSGWKKVGTYVKDESKVYEDISRDFLNLTLRNERINITSVSSDNFNENAGSIEERKNIFSRWQKKKGLENLEIIRFIFKY